MQTRTATKSVPLKMRIAGTLILKPKRRYYTGKANRMTSGGESESFNTESVVCGDGRRSKNVLSLRNLVIYASDRIDGGVESYYKVDPESLMFTTRAGRRGRNWHTRAVSDHAKTIKQQAVPRVNIPSAKRGNYNWVREKLRHAPLSWLYENCGCALSVGGPGERMSISGVDEYLVRDFGTVFEKQNNRNCITAAIANAIDLVSGWKIGEAMRKYFHDENPHYLKIREATLLLHDLDTGAEMRLVPKKYLKVFNANRFGYLANRESGVYIVHLFQPNGYLAHRGHRR